MDLLLTAIQTLGRHTYRLGRLVSRLRPLPILYGFDGPGLTSETVARHDGRIDLLSIEVDQNKRQYEIIGAI